MPLEPYTANLIWIDLEMTGLDPDTHRIIQIATLITDNQLKLLAKGPELAIHQSAAELAKMDSWNVKHHGQSGLIDKVRQTTLTEADAEKQTLAFLRQYVAPNTSPMCGNSICQDRRFLVKTMPRLEKYFHYRHLDVTTLKILTQCWAPELLNKMNKTAQHTAMQDIIDSVDELEFYRQHLKEILNNGKT